MTRHGWHACQSYLADVHRIVPGSFQVRGHPVGDVLIQQKPHADRAMGRWYSRSLAVHLSMPPPGRAFFETWIS